MPFYLNNPFYVAHSGFVVRQGQIDLLSLATIGFVGKNLNPVSIKFCLYILLKRNKPTLTVTSQKMESCIQTFAAVSPFIEVRKRIVPTIVVYSTLKPNIYLSNAISPIIEVRRSKNPVIRVFLDDCGDD